MLTWAFYVIPWRWRVKTTLYESEFFRTNLFTVGRILKPFLSSDRRRLTIRHVALDVIPMSILFGTLKDKLAIFVAPRIERRLWE
jgi:hypothetical protein